MAMGVIMNVNSDPVVVKRYHKTIIPFLLRIEYKVEDRRPDLEDYRGKYKHYLNFHVLWYRYNWTYRTALMLDDDLPIITNKITGNYVTSRQLETKINIVKS